VRVVSNNFSAVDGRNSGAQIQVVTKSGTNQLHGGASYYFENNTLADRNEFEASVPVFRRNEFDYFIGGRPFAIVPSSLRRMTGCGSPAPARPW